MIYLLFTFALSVFPLLAQASPSCPSGSDLTTRITQFVIGATPDKVFGVTGDFFNAESNVDRTNKVNSFSVNWKSANSVTFAAAAAKVRIPYYEQNFEIEPRCSGSTHSTGKWRSRLCISGDSSRDAATEWFEARHRNAVQNVLRGLGVEGWMEEQLNGEIPGCGAVTTTTAPPSSTSTSTSASSTSSTSSAAAGPSPTTAPEPVPRATPGQTTIISEQKTAGGHKGKADTMFALTVCGMVVPISLWL